MKVFTPAILLLMMAVLGCSSEPAKTETKSEPAAKAEEPKIEALTGRSAFQKLYITARTWAADARPYQARSGVTPQANGQDGKAAIWHASFGSPGRRAGKSFTWSGSSEENAPEVGVTPSPEESFNPGNASTQVFDIAFLKIDTDKAFEIAQQKGGAALLKADPKTPVHYELDWNGNKNQLVWRVMYGPSPSSAKLTVNIDASTGVFIDKN